MQKIFFCFFDPLSTAVIRSDKRAVCHAFVHLPAGDDVTGRAR